MEKKQIKSLSVFVAILVIVKGQNVADDAPSKCPEEDCLIIAKIVTMRFLVAIVMLLIYYNYSETELISCIYWIWLSGWELGHG